MKIKGTVQKKLVDGKGFIKYTDKKREREIVFYIQDVRPEYVNDLIQGQEVEFTVEQGGNNRPVARDILLVGSKANEFDRNGQVVSSTGNVTLNRPDLFTKSPEKDFNTKLPFSRLQQILGHITPSYYLPEDSLSLLDDLLLTDNIALFINKLAYYDQNKFDFMLGNRKINHRKKDFLIRPERFNMVPLQEINNRREKALKGSGLILERFKMQVDWRLAAGVGGDSVYETSIILHPVYGFPYLPGSAIKGVIRSRVINWLFDYNEKNGQDGALNDPGFRMVFGSSKEGTEVARQGIVHFFDALPIAAPTISLDIINPHYSQYYSKNDPPGDYHNPMPVSFLTVIKTSFAFYIGIRKGDNKVITSGRLVDQTPLEVASAWLYHTLTEHGLGAKSSVGYGVMTEIEQL